MYVLEKKVCQYDFIILIAYEIKTLFKVCNLKKTIHFQNFCIFIKKIKYVNLKMNKEIRYVFLEVNCPISNRLKKRNYSFDKKNYSYAPNTLKIKLC